ncbi:MAG: class I SAM-dependent methyltransferase [Nitrospirae bacterium]|nr:class I SAM-dependent methyltransferase [Nitrospirota bacterium]
MKQELSQNNIKIFNHFTHEYDEWFDINRFAYLSEIEAVRRFLPCTGIGIEIGGGTGRFSEPLGVKIVVEPAGGMTQVAKLRGLEVIRAIAEQLPFADSSIDYALMVNVICFLSDPLTALNEVRRILKPDGCIIIAIIDKESQLGRKYEHSKGAHKFYSQAIFYSTQQVKEFLNTLNFQNIQICQTIFNDVNNMDKPDPVLEGFGSGGFVVLSGIKG